MTRSNGWGDPPDTQYDELVVNPYTQWREEYRRTGICPRLVSPRDVAHQPCVVCGHNDYVHGGFLNRGDPDLVGCLICALKLRAYRDSRDPAELEGTD